jgi:hypothetical protein
VDRLADDGRVRHKYDDAVAHDIDARNAERTLRAAVRAGRMTVEVVALGQRQPSPYATLTPERGSRLLFVSSNIIRRLVAGF